MAAGVLILVLVSLSWTAKSQFLSSTACQQPTNNPTSSSPCSCSSGQQFLSSSGSIGSGFRSPSLTRPLFEAEALNLGSQCGCELPSQQFLTPSGPTGSIGSSLRQSTLFNTGPQFEPDTLRLGSFNNECGCSSPTSQLTGHLAPTLKQSGFTKCETPVSNLGSFGADLGCSTSSSQLLGTAGSFSRPLYGSITTSQCETSASNLGTFGSGCGTLSTNLLSNVPNGPSCGINNFPVPLNPSFISNGPKCGLNNFAGPITNLITEAITTLPSKQFVSENFISQKPCQSSLGLAPIELPSAFPNVGQCNGIRNIPVTPCASSVIESCTTLDDEESISNTLANALQLLIVSNLIENLNEAAALGTLNSPCASEIVNLGTGTVIESGPGCTEIITPIKPIVTGCSNSPSFNSLSSFGSLSSNPLGASRLGSCNNGFKEFVDPITVPPLGTIGGVPEIINSKVSFGAPNIPDVINPINLRLAEALKSKLPIGPLASYGRDFVNKINPISIPSYMQPSVLPEIGNPVNLPSVGALFPNKAEINPFNVQSYSPLVPSPVMAYNIPYGSQLPETFNYNQFNGPQVPEAFGYNQFNGPLQPEAYNYNQFNGPQVPEAYNYNQFNGPQVPEPYNYNQFNGPLLPDAFNYNQFNAPQVPEAYHYNQFYGPQQNPLMALLEQLLAEKMNQYTPYGPPETYNPYSSYGPYTEQSNSYNGYGSFSEIGSGSQVSEVVTQLDTISSQTPYGTSSDTVPLTLSLGSSSYAGNSEIISPILPSSSYSALDLSSLTSSSLNNGFSDISSSAYSNAFTSAPTPPNPYSYPEIMYVPIDIPGIPVTLTGTLPDVPYSVTPGKYFNEMADIPAQLLLEPMVAELLIPSAIPAQITVSI